MEEEDASSDTSDEDYVPDGKANDYGPLVRRVTGLKVSAKLNLVGARLSGVLLRIPHTTNQLRSQR